jgi:hypothetical protein
MTGPRLPGHSDKPGEPAGVPTDVLLYEPLEA